MNPWAWMGDGESCRKELSELRYDRSNNFISENNQASHSDGLQLQAVLNLMDNHEDDGGYICVPGFWRQFNEYFNTVPADLSKPMYNFPTKGAVFKRAIRVPMKAGSMVVWDQRMAHGSLPNASPNPRCAQFIKMFPKRIVDKQRAFHRARELKGEIANAGFEREVTQLGRSLFGFDYSK